MRTYKGVRSKLQKPLESKHGQTPKGFCFGKNSIAIAKESKISYIGTNRSSIDVIGFTSRLTPLNLP